MQNFWVLVMFFLTVTLSVLRWRHAISGKHNMSTLATCQSILPFNFILHILLTRSHTHTHIVHTLPTQSSYLWEQHSTVSHAYSNIVCFYVPSSNPAALEGPTTAQHVTISQAVKMYPAVVVYLLKNSSIYWIQEILRCIPCQELLVIVAVFVFVAQVEFQKMKISTSLSWLHLRLQPICVCEWWACVCVWEREEWVWIDTLT